jgi:hypothetical protein
MDQHPIGINIVVDLDDAAVPVAMGMVTMSSPVDKEIPPAQVQRRQNGIQGTLRVAIDEDFVRGRCNTETRRMIVMGRAASLPLVSVRPGLWTTVRNPRWPRPQHRCRTRVRYPLAHLLCRNELENRRPDG